jgi:hypothetical protein
MRATTKKVNAALEAAGFAGAEIVRGAGYFYFAGPGYVTGGVYVYHLTSLTVEEWVAEFKQVHETTV